MPGNAPPSASTGRCRPPVLITLALVAPLATPLSGCSGRQSALDPAGTEAGAVHDLFFVMLIGGAVIWTLVMALLLYAGRSRPEPVSAKTANRLILWGGVAFPVTVLFLLLAYAVWLMPQVRPWLGAGPTGEPQIEATGEQFWWRLRYLEGPGQPGFETANELRLPVGERTIFALEAADVIHSFWIPTLGGKMDMIPGRTNILSLEPTRTGTFRGPCAEFCGTSHALMAFTVVVMERADYDSWRAAQAAGHPAVPQALQAGRDLFFRHGCAACHAINGTAAIGRVGPDLTRIASRGTLAAGTLSNTPDNLARFIRDPGAVKPGVKMPAYTMLPAAEIDAIAAYLGDLR
ncbi:cytochrome c oxidase subunit II [Rhizobium sp. CC-YZS058]|uniref:cytochrome c oxidase subunit II n=1 Tax=Rhizobium sp. CC-YZS058 TaxID=3042153 RepID=UPI002B05C54C|nr:cytochrome c oxidase subunit II [Rhizobium sp. CC-YZS058]MEA3533946.1 cytochrome c oxidase subunit II [Rhizobium sp. CC-YZS058]